MENQPQSNQSMSKPVVWVILVVVIVILAVGAYFLLKQGNTNTNTDDGLNTNVDTSSWLTYTNEKYGYKVRYPSGATYRELTSGSRGNEDLGYIVDFTLGEVIIRILSGDSNKSSTLSQLVNAGVPLSVNEKSNYSTVIINNKTSWKYKTTVQTDAGEKEVGANTILLGNNYYYQITTGNQFTPEFTSERETVYDTFVSTFELL